MTMKVDKFVLMKRYVQQATGSPLESLPLEALSGADAAEALWPLNERFRPHLEQIRSLPYDALFEGEADAALEQLADEQGADWTEASAGAWRVLLERQQQGIVVAMANDRTGKPLMPIPHGLTAAQRTVVVALFLLHGMKLPFPAEDRSAFVLPAGSARASLRRH